MPYLTGRCGGGGLDASWSCGRQVALTCSLQAEWAAPIFGLGGLDFVVAVTLVSLGAAGDATPVGAAFLLKSSLRFSSQGQGFG